MLTDREAARGRLAMLRNPERNIRDTKTVLGKRMRKARWTAGITQAHLGRLIKVRHSQISRYEYGLAVPSSSKLRLIAKALNVKSSYLLGRGEQ